MLQLPFGVGRFASRLRSEGRQRWTVGHFACQSEGQSRHPLDALGHDALDIIAGAVIVVVQAGVKHDDGDAASEKRMVVAVRFQLPVEVEQQVFRLIQAADRLPKSGRRARPDDFQFLAAEAADHIHIEGEFDAIERHGGRPHPVRRAEQAFFLGIPEREQHASLRRRGQSAEGVDQFQQRRRPAGVVIRSVMHGSNRTTAVHTVPVANVVVVRPEQHDFFAEPRVAPRP